MVTIPTREELEAYISLTPEERRTVNRDPAMFLLFFSYYFSEAVKYPFAQFHADFANDLVDLYHGRITQLVWCTARETAKSAFASGWLLWLILNSRDDYFNVDSYDKANSEGFTFDVSNHLLTNRRLIADYGELYPRQSTASEKTRARVGDFTIPSSNVRVEAHTTLTPVRGRRHDVHIRPSWIIMDDFETIRTVSSEADTLSVRQHISEFATGLDQKRMRIIYLCNWLSDSGNVAMLKDKASLSDKTRFREVWRVDKTTGQPTWPGRDVLTDAELTLPGNGNKVSIESKRLEMRNKDTGDADWEREMQGMMVDLANARFRNEMFRPISLKDVLSQSPVNCFVTIDTPSKKEGLENDGRDRCGICVNFVNASGDWHLMARGEYYGPTAVVEEMVRLWSWLTDEIKVKPSVMAWEDTAYTRALEPLLKIEKDRHKVFFSLTWLGHKGRSKTDRIRSGLLHRYETGRIWHISGHCQGLEEEAKRFPNGTHDDILDAVAYQSDVVRLPKDRAAMTDRERRFYEVMREKRIREKKNHGSLRMA